METDEEFARLAIARFDADDFFRDGLSKSHLSHTLAEWVEQRDAAVRAEALRECRDLVAIYSRSVADRLEVLSGFPTDEAKR